MARRPFGGTTADVAQDIAGDRVSGATITVWTAATGGTQLTDLQTPAGVALTGGVVTSDANGIFSFLGPDDGTSVVYADGGLGGRTKMLSTDLADRVGTLESSPAGGTAALTTFTPTGTVGSTNVQDAVVEVASEAAAALAAALAAGATDAELAAAISAEATARANADALLAPLASPAFTGNPTVPTQTAGNNSTRAASTAFVQAAVGTSVAQTVTNGVTDTAPSQDAVYDAIAAEAALRIGGDATAVTTAVGQSITKAALGIGHGLYSSLPQNIAPLINPAFGPNLWALANFTSFNQVLDTNGSVQTTTVTPSISAVGGNFSLHTRIDLQKAVPQTGFSTALGKYRVTFDVTSTQITGGGTLQVRTDFRGTDGAINNVWDQHKQTTSGAITVVSLSSSDAPMTGRRFVLEFDLANYQPSGAGYYFDLRLVAAGSVAVGTIGLTNVTVQQITATSRIMRAGFDRAPTSTSAQFYADIPLGLDDSGYARFARQIYAVEGSPLALTSTAVYYQVAFGYDYGSFPRTPSGTYRSAQLNINNCDMVLSMVKNVTTTTELRGNAHGGETGLTGTYATDVQVYVDYGDGTWVRIQAYDAYAHYCFRIKIVQQTSITRTEQGSPFANVSRTTYIYNDGTVRQDRTVQFLSNQTVAGCFWHMASFNPGNYTQSTVATAQRGRIGRGQQILQDADFRTKLLPPAQTASSTASTGGTIPGGFQYGLRVTALLVDGETTPSIVNTFIGVGSATNTNTVTANWSAVSGATGYAIYFGLPGSERRVATVAGGTLTYTVLGSEVPTLPAPLKNTAFTTAADDMLITGLGDWAAFYEPIMDAVFSSCLDRTSVKSMPGVAEVTARLQRLSGTVVKNYWNLAFTGSNGRADVTSATTWTGTTWFFVYCPQDSDKFEREQTIRGGAAASLTSVYPT